MEPIRPNLRAKILCKYPEANTDLDEYERLLGQRFQTDLLTKDSNDNRIKQLHSKLFGEAGVVDEHSVQEVLESIPPSAPLRPFPVLTDEDPFARLGKPYIGNTTREQFLNGLTQTASELPNILNQWDSIDPDLRAEYIDQVQWLLNMAVLKIHDLEAELDIEYERR